MSQLPQLDIPPLFIGDAPRFGWRGLSVDIARHWYGPETLRKVIDIAAHYRLNRLHLHLTDDQGWRIEVPAYPALTKISGRTQVGGQVPEGDLGYLTLDDYRELQEYALERGVVVVPEIDLPGHINAALHALPELNPDGKATEAYGGIDVGHSALRAANRATKPFITAVLETISAHTLGEWVHVGGDEVPLLPADEYAELVRHAVSTVVAAGKKPVMWQEGASALDADMLRAHEIYLQFWQHQIDAAPYIEAARNGARIILSPATNAYLDMRYDDGDTLGTSWGGSMPPIDLHQARAWEPTELLPGLPDGAIVGVEAAVWTENCRNEADLFSMLFPRLPAIADIAWSPRNTSLSNDDGATAFIERLQPHAALWAEWGLPSVAAERLASAAGAVK